MKLRVSKMVGVKLSPMITKLNLSDSIHALFLIFNNF